MTTDAFKDLCDCVNELRLARARLVAAYRQTTRKIMPRSMDQFLENDADDATFDRFSDDIEADAKAALLEIPVDTYDPDGDACPWPSGEKVLFAIGDRPASSGGTGFSVSGECTSDQWPIIEAVIETARHMASELAPKMQAAKQEMGCTVEALPVKPAQ